MSLTKLLLLPTVATAPAICLTLDAQGETVLREILPAGAPAMEGHEPCVLAVPSADVGLHRLRIRASSGAQAVAAAARLLESRLAVAYASPHVAVSDASDQDERWVGVVDPERMKQWLERAANLGFLPTAMVPDCLLMPPPAGSAWRVCRTDTTWRVRGETTAFSAEPDLARALLDAQGLTGAEVDTATEADLGRGAVLGASGIDLLQQGFSRHPGAATGWAAWRTSAWLAALVLALVPLGFAAQALRHGLATRAIHVAANAQLEATGGVAAAPGSPFDRANSALANARSRDAFAITSGALFEALAQVPGAGVSSLEFGADGLMAASIDHGQAEDVERLTSALAARGVSASLDATQPAGARFRSVVLLGVSP